MRKILMTALAAFAAVATPALAEFPERSVRLIVPYPAGGSTDVLGRLIAEQLSEGLGESVVVENRPGAGGNIGTEAMIRSEADGYSVSVGGGANAVNQTLYKNLPYDFADDAQPLGMIGTVPNIIVVPADSPFQTLQDLIDQAKENPGEMNYASSGVGATTHLAGELFKSVAGDLDIVHVPYQGSAPALTDVIAGRLDFMVDNLASSLPLIKSGQLRPLAVTAPERQPTLPDVPTLKEAGVDASAVSFFAIFAPSGTPDEIVQRYNEEIRDIVASPEVAAKLSDLAAQPHDMTPDELSAFVREQIQNWAEAIEIAGVPLQE